MPNVPPLRFLEFTGEWEKQSFADNLLRLENGTNYDTNETEGLPLSRIETISTSSINYEKVGHCNTKNIDHYKMEYGDILFSHINSMSHIGKTAYYYAEQPLYHGMNLLLIRCNSRLNSLFFYHLLNTPRFLRTCQVYAKQAVNQASISTSDIKKIQIHVPSIHEQNKIAAFISLIDQRISTQIRVIEDLQTLKKAINDYLQAHFEPVFNLSFSDLGTEFGGLSGKNAHDFGIGDPYITYMGVYAKNFVTENDCGLVTVLPTENQNKVNNGDVLFTLSSETPDEVCYGSVYVGEAKNVYLNSFCFGVHINNSNVYSPYLAYFINSTIFRKAVFPLAQGSTRFNLQKSDFLKKRFSFPSLEMQIEIFRTLNTIENKLQIESELLDQYKQQKQYLLQQMFI